VRGEVVAAGRAQDPWAWSDGRGGAFTGGVGVQHGAVRPAPGLDGVHVCAVGAGQVCRMPGAAAAEVQDAQALEVPEDAAPGPFAAGPT
jgi:hypothetical protein